MFFAFIVAVVVDYSNSCVVHSILLCASVSGWDPIKVDAALIIHEILMSKALSPFLLLLRLAD